MSAHAPADVPTFEHINDFARHTSWLHGVMTAYASYGVVLFAVLIAVGYVLGWRRRSTRALAAAAWTAGGTLLAVAINQPIVNAVAELRPYYSLPHVELLVGRSQDFGLPSDHATMAGAVAMGLVFVSRRIGVVAWVAALLLAFSRVYVGAHYPQDVLAGLALGAVTAAAGWLLLRGLLFRLVAWVAASRFRLLVNAPDSAGEPGKDMTPAAV